MHKWREFSFNFKHIMCKNIFKLCIEDAILEIYFHEGIEKNFHTFLFNIKILRKSINIKLEQKVE